MSDTMIFSPGSSRQTGLLEAFGYGVGKSVPFGVMKTVAQLLGIFAERRIDDETAVAILRSFETQNGRLDDAHLRVNRFSKFIHGLHASTNSRQPFIDTVKNLGLLSKNELEEHAKETGDWTHFLKRAEKESKNAPTVGEVT